MLDVQAILAWLGSFVSQSLAEEGDVRLLVLGNLGESPAHKWRESSVCECFLVVFRETFDVESVF